MSEDWENIVIETGVDTLLNYLVENQKASVEQISEDLGVSEDRIKTWAEGLEDEGFLEKQYSARKGLLLKYTKKNKEEAESRLDELREKVDEQAEDINDELESRSSEVEEAQSKLEEMMEELEENKEKEEELQEQLDELKELENKLEKRFEETKDKEEKVHSRTVSLISRIDSALNRIEDAEETASRFEEEKQDIRKKLKAIKKLESHVKKADDLKDKLEELEDEEEKSKNIFKSFKDRIGGIFSGKSVESETENLLEGNIPEVKEKIRNRENVDYDRLIQKEKNGENRVTVVKWLEDRKDE